MTNSVVEVLEQQHERVAQLFERVSAPDEDRPIVLNRLLKELAAHVAAERATVVPLIADVGLDADLERQIGQDHQTMQKLMVKIERRKFNSPDVPGLLTRLASVVADHDERSRRELFPGLRQRLSEQDQVALADRLQGEDALVMSHPHPHLLSLGGMADKVTALVGKWDQWRDTTVNVRHPAGTDDAPDQR